MLDKLLPMFLATIVAGCAMISSWKSIPPPGGCDQCHTIPISNNWEASLKPVTLTSEIGPEAWQKPGSVLPQEPTPLEQKKITEQRCFRCHKGPDKAHTEYKGRYHH